MEDMADYLNSATGNVAIFDATNTTKHRRRILIDFCQKKRLRCFFIESVCDDQAIIDSNVTDVKNQIKKESKSAQMPVRRKKNCIL
uniref:6PF2K domain-containing protein n=1 Tax=Caenorhabditis japonica TaxID=281687 RepID=A0A8R1IJM1_CAEJA